MKDDAKKGIQRLTLEGEPYILIRESAYNKLLHRLESLDTALDLQKTKTQAVASLFQSLLQSDLDQSQVRQLVTVNSFGERLRLLRQFRNLKQADLAEKANLEQSVISKLENGKIESPSYETVHNLLAALEVPEGASYTLLKEGSVEAALTEEESAG
jgi:ribosome-binding protein aMBF1 (putative translation factor)